MKQEEELKQPWESAADHQMTRLLDTDLWYKTGFEALPNLSP